MNTPLSDNTLSRFAGIARLYGQQALHTLQASHILIIGIGGVGSWTAEALARSGVGTISLMDLDDICISNTNRQVHTTVDTIGQSKTEIMAKRLLAINPEIQIHIIHDFLDRDNITDYIDSRYAMVIDSIDSLMTKSKLINHCKRQKISMITIGSAGGKKDPQKIIVSDLSKTINDPLLSKARNNVRRLYGFSREKKRSFGIPAVYSSEQMTYPDQNGGTSHTKQYLEEGASLDCSQGFGAATMVTATFGFVAASEAIKRIVKKAQRASQ